jgi:hypothetical protein
MRPALYQDPGSVCSALIANRDCPGTREATMTSDEPVDLDRHRSQAAQSEIRGRRERLKELMLENGVVELDREELETVLFATPCDTWLEAAVRAQYLIQLYSETEDAQQPRRRELVARVLDDLSSLCQAERERS